MNSISPTVVEVKRLIELRCEGTYWDFKRVHHTDNGQLIHDVLCMANCDHDGKRYIIFGVDDSDYRIYSIDCDKGRRTSAQISSLFRDNAKNFAENSIPDFKLVELHLANDIVDVLIIEDVAKKPYSLIRKIATVRPYYIYTRINDTNTPIDESAQNQHVEKMWRQRWGVDFTPLERVRKYLIDPMWSRIDGDQGPVFHHNLFPEFTVRSAEGIHSADCQEEWTRGEIRRDNNRSQYVEIKYHQTTLSRIRIVIFDGSRKTCVAPKSIVHKSGRLYFYEQESIEYALHRFFCGQSHRDDSKGLRIAGSTPISTKVRNRWPEGLKIPVVRGDVFRDYCDKRVFVSESGIDPDVDDIEQYLMFLENQLEFDDWLHCQ